MGKKKAQIPIETTGAEQAQRDLRETGQAIGDLGNKQSQSSRGAKENAKANSDAGKNTKSVGDATKQTARSVQELDDKAKTAARTLVTTFNPALGSAFSLVSDLFEGLLRINPVLLGLSVAAAAIGGVVTAFEKMAIAADKAEAAIARVAEAQKKLREQSTEEKDTLVRDFQDAGIIPNRQLVENTARRRRNLAFRGDGPAIPRDIATQGLIAQQLAGLSDDEVEQFFAGRAVTPEFAFSGDARQDRTKIRRVVARGRDADAQTALSDLSRSLLVSTRKQALAEQRFGPNEELRALIESEIEILNQNIGTELSDKAKRTIFDIIDQQGVKASRRDFVEAISRQEFPIEPFPGEAAKAGPTKVPGTTRTIDDLAGIAEEIGRRLQPAVFGGTAGSSTATPAIGERATIINNYYNVGELIQTQDGTADRFLNGESHNGAMPF